MNRLAAAVAALLRWLTRLLPADRQDWGEAVWSEAADLPPGWPRLRWYAGGLWVVATEAALVRLAAYTLLGIGAGVGQVWLNWGSGVTGSGWAANRAGHVVMMATLVALPWLARRRLGPVAPHRAARTIRAAGMIGLYLLLLALAGVSHATTARIDDDTSADVAGWVVNAVVITVLTTTWAYGILALTSTRHCVPGRHLARGVGAGAAVAGLVYALMPTGHLVAHNPATVAAVVLVPPAAVLLSSIRTRRVELGMLVGLTAAGTAALVTALLTVPTMLAFPHRVTLEWANPDAGVPHGTAFEWQMSLGDAANHYVLMMVFAPILGLMLGAIGGVGLAGDEPDPRATN